MANNKQKRKPSTTGSGSKAKTPPPPPPPAPRPTTTTTAIAADPVLGYKLRVLLHDFANVTKDPGAARRINQTTDEHYISGPYFTVAEAALVKAAVVDVDVDVDTRGRPVAGEEEEEAAAGGGLGLDVLPPRGRALGDAVASLLDNFLEKRRASGDTRPCGPHHLAPLYASLFAVDLRDVRDENFLRRLRRCGL